jgi:hypothetical protein
LRWRERSGWRPSGRLDWRIDERSRPSFAKSRTPGGPTTQAAFYLPNRPPRQPKPGEWLFAFLRGHDPFLCELRHHGAYGIEAQFWKNEEFLIGRRFDPALDATRTSRELAVQWATAERKAIEASSDED